MEDLLTIHDLQVEYRTDDGIVHAVNDVDFSVRKGEAMGLIGETGAGKTTTALSILGILPEPVGKMVSGEICFEGQMISELSDKEMRSVRGKKISMIFQDPMTSLNPIISVGDQIEEMLYLHFRNLSKEERSRKVDEILQLVGIPPERKSEYPFQFSGGMKQRVGIAMALVCEPDLLIADEPTTALDVTIQAQILELMRELKDKLGTSLIMITHDFGIVAQLCDRVSVMYAGEIVESGTVEDVFAQKRNHPYTEGLFNCIPKLDSKEDRLKPISGYVVDPIELPGGCKFHERCPYANERCRKENPGLFEKDGHSVKCFRYEEVNES